MLGSDHTRDIRICGQMIDLGHWICRGGVKSTTGLKIYLPIWGLTFRRGSVMSEDSTFHHSIESYRVLQY